MSKIIDLLSGTKILEERDSQINGKLKVVKDYTWGTYIQAEGLTQSGGVVTNVWRNTLKKVASYQIKFESCLILGLGGGAVAKLVSQKWPGIKIEGVDLDPNMIELGEKYFHLKDIGVKTTVGDALVYCKKLAKQKRKFDLIISDVYQGSNLPEQFETEDFSKLISNLLSPQGIAVFNRLFYGEKRILAYRFLGKLEKIFPFTYPVYPQANVMFICRH